MKKNFIDRYNNEEDSSFWTFNKKLCTVLAAFLLIIGVVTGCAQKQDNPIDEPVEELSQESVKIGNDGVNAAMAPDEDDVEIVSRQNEQPKEQIKMVAMSVEDTGRSDPFLPDGERGLTRVRAKAGYDLLPPPEVITVDTQATEVMSTKVSGIMYDAYNPSAILNISGSDYLVRSGDVVNGYKVLSIARNYVTVQNGVNVYKAGVGEILSTNNINFNTVSNLEGKFGGTKNVANKK